MKNAEQLLQILRKQHDTLSEYLTLQHKKTEVLISGDIGQLDEIVLSEQSYMMKMDSLEKKRGKLLKEDGLFGITISEIIEKHLDGGQAADFRNVFAGLGHVISELKKANTLNQRLLRERLTVIQRINQKLTGGSLE